jgi:hypothetical protein
MFSKVNTLTALAAAITVICSATSAGAADRPDPVQVSGVTSPDSVPYLSREIASISKTIYTLSAQPGAYGRKLAEDGWAFVSAHPSTVPNTPDTVVYFNSAVDHANLAELSDFYTTFKGTLVVDSEKIYDTSSQKSRALRGPVEQETLEPDTANGTLEAFYTDLSRGQGLIPHGTALVSAGLKRVVHAVNIGSDGSYNGMDWKLFKSASDLVFVAAENVHAGTKLAANSEDHQKIVDYSRYDTAVGMASYQEGWWAIGYVYIDAYTMTDGKKYVASRVSSGTGDAECLYLRMRCGIYPATADDVAWVNYRSNTQVEINSYAHGYEAHTYYGTVDSANPVLEYSPSATAWTSTDALEKDYVERTWSQGFAVGGSMNVTSFQPSISSGYSRADTYTKRTDRWNGVAWIFPMYPNPGSGVWGIGVASGISLKPEYRYQINGFQGTAINPSSQYWDIQNIEARSSYAFLLQMTRVVCGGTNFYIYTPARPRLSYHGYRPGVSALFKVGHPLGPSVVTGALKWYRSSANYTHSTGWNCFYDSVRGEWARVSDTGWKKDNTWGMVSTSYAYSKAYVYATNVSVPYNYFDRR